MWVHGEQGADVRYLELMVNMKWKTEVIISAASSPQILKKIKVEVLNYVE